MQINIYEIVDTHTFGHKGRQGPWENDLTGRYDRSKAKDKMTREYVTHTLILT